MLEPLEITKTLYFWNYITLGLQDFGIQHLCDLLAVDVPTKKKDFGMQKLHDVKASIPINFFKGL